MIPSSTGGQKFGAEPLRTDSMIASLSLGCINRSTALAAAQIQQRPDQLKAEAHSNLVLLALLHWAPHGAHRLA